MVDVHCGEWNSVTAKLLSRIFLCKESTNFSQIRMSSFGAQLDGVQGV
jgi:hypothetical protein